MPLLSQHGAPPTLWKLCRSQLLRAPLRSQLLGGEVGSMLELLAATTFSILLQPLSKVGRSSQALAIELMTALLYAAPAPIASSLCQV